MNSRQCRHHHSGRLLVDVIHLGEDGLRVDYNRSVWRSRQVDECRVTELQGKHRLEAPSSSLGEHHQEVQA
jgi:hypothetical protein